MELLMPSYLEFLSTLSLRRATATVALSGLNALNFYPRSPCGERHAVKKAVGDKLYISIHALLAESDHNADIAAELYCSISIHALLAESDWHRMGR